MERGETRIEKATRFSGGKFDGVEYHVYRMGHLTDYPIGVVHNVRGKWKAKGEAASPVDVAVFGTRRAAIAALCKADDLNA